VREEASLAVSDLLDQIAEYRVHYPEEVQR